MFLCVIIHIKCGQTRRSIPRGAGSSGSGSGQTQVLRKPQHELTEARENKRSESLRKSLRRKFSVANTVSTKTESTYLSVNKLIMQFVGVPAMRETVMDGRCNLPRSMGSLLGRSESSMCPLGGNGLQTYRGM